MEKGIVYKCVVDGLIYIGITTNLDKRIKEHLRNAPKYPNRKFYSALNGANTVEWETIETCNTFNEACHREKYWIDIFNSNASGLNMTKGGQGTFGSKRPKSKKWRKLHAKRMIENNPRSGIKLDDGTRHKISKSVKLAYNENRINVSGKNNGMYGKQHTDEWKSNHSLKIKKLHESGRYRKANTKTVEKNSKLWEITDPNGEQVIIKNLSEFCRRNKLSQSSMILVSQGKQKSHKNWTVKKL